MLKKLREQENLILLFFVVTLFGVVFYVVIDKSVMDVFYLMVLFVYFACYLKLRKCKQ